jgi:hypothetical protein
MVLIQEQLRVRSQLAALFIGQKNVAWKADGHVNGELEIDGLLHKRFVFLPLGYVFVCRRIRCTSIVVRE